MENLSAEMEFFVFLLEHYAAARKSTAAKILKKWDKLAITDMIYKMYWRYHTEALENAFADIDALTNKAQART